MQEDEVYVRLKNGHYIKIWYSDNPPAYEKNEGCVGYDVYDEHMSEVDGGELDITWKDDSIRDAIRPIIECQYLGDHDAENQWFEIVKMWKAFIKEV